jgi:peptide/nickel transport system ATP-binding protein
VFEPQFIVADEPVAMVDVSIRAQILDPMASLKKELGLTYLFVTHDLATANYFCDRIAVMYLGKIAEVAQGRTSTYRRTHVRDPSPRPKIQN